MTLLAGILSLLVSLVCFWGAVYWLRLRKRIMAWPTVVGHITARAAIQPTDRGRTSTPGWRWAPDVRFSYRVNGNDYQGDKFTLPWSATTSKQRVEALLATIPNAVNVHFDPTNPKVSCLFPPAVNNVLIYAIAGVGVLIVSAMWMLPLLVGT